MLLLSKAKWAFGPQLIRVPFHFRTLTNISLNKSPLASNFRSTNREFTRCFNSLDESDNNSMTLARSASNINSTLESGTINVVKVPSMGKKLKRCKIYKWLKKPGDYVNVDDLLCILETDLIFGKVYSKVEGTIIENVNQEGSTVSVGSDLAVLVNNTMLSPSFQDSKFGGFNYDGRRSFSTKKYVPMISFTRVKKLEMDEGAFPNYLPSIALGASTHPKDPEPLNPSTQAPNPVTSDKGTKGKGVFVLDDFYKSPYRTWLRKLSDEEINLVNHGTIDVK